MAAVAFPFLAWTLRFVWSKDSKEGVMPDARNDGKTTKRISAVVAGVVVSPDWLECTSLRDPRCLRPITPIPSR